MTDYKDDLTPRESFAFPEPLGFPGSRSMSHKTETRKGIFYGVSVGPGAAGLVTLDAVRLIMHCPVVAAPRTRTGEMLALDIGKRGVLQFLELSFGSRMAEASLDSFWAGKTVLPLDFPMSHNAEERERSHRAVAEQLKPYLDRRMDIAMLNLGDASVYATVHYIADLLEADGYETNMQAGVTSFCASAAALDMSLTEGFDTPIFILPGALSDEDTDRLLDERGTKVLMKTIGVLPEVLAALKEKGLAETTSVVVNCGLPGEQVYKTLAEFEAALLELPEAAYSYFTTLIVKEPEVRT